MASAASHTKLSFFIPLRSSQVHWWQMGEGDQCIIAFHGFSEAAVHFEALVPALPPNTMLLAMDFPYHGRTKWQEEQFSQEDLLHLVQAVLAKFQLKRFSMMGFSMGGRLALSLVPQVVAQLDRLILLAPDGIQTHKVFDLAVYPVWGRWAFRLVTKRPGLFFFTVKMLYRSGHLSRFIYEFTLNHMDTPDKRYRIFHTWLSLKQFVPDVPQVQTLLRKYQVPTHLLFGKTDEVIRPGIGRKFVQEMPEATFDLVPKGHKLVDKVTVPFLQKILSP